MNNQLGNKEMEVVQLNEKLAESGGKLAEAEAVYELLSERMSRDQNETASLAAAIERCRVEEGRKHQNEVATMSSKMLALDARRNGLQTSLCRLQEEANKKEEQIETLLVDVTTPRAPTCVVCMERESTHAYVACGHFAMCNACLVSSGCAICRSTRTATMRISMS